MGPQHEPLVHVSAEPPSWPLIANGGANTKSIKVFLDPEILKIPPRSTMQSVLRGGYFRLDEERVYAIKCKSQRA